MDSNCCFGQWSISVECHEWILARNWMLAKRYISKQNGCHSSRQNITIASWFAGRDCEIVSPHMHVFFIFISFHGQHAVHVLYSIPWTACCMLNFISWTARCVLHFIPWTACCVLYLIQWTACCVLHFISWTACYVLHFIPWTACCVLHFIPRTACCVQSGPD